MLLINTFITKMLLALTTSCDGGAVTCPPIFKVRCPVVKKDHN